MERGRTPSTPADRAPRLPRTRSHATVRKRRISDKVEQVIEPSTSIVDSPLVQLGLDLQYSQPPPRRGSATTRRCSPATSWHSSNRTANSLGPFAMCTAFPCSDYYGPSAPSRRHQPTVDLPADQLAAGREGRPRNGSHVHHVPVDRIGAQLSPCSLANGYAAGIHRGLPTDVNGRLRSRLARASGSTRTAARPASTRLEPVPHLRGFNRWFTIVTPVCLACRTRTIWRC